MTLCFYLPCLTHIKMLYGLLELPSFKEPALSTHSLLSSQGHENIHFLMAHSCESSQSSLKNRWQCCPDWWIINTAWLEQKEKTEARPSGRSDELPSSVIQPETCERRVKRTALATGNQSEVREIWNERGRGEREGIPDVLFVRLNISFCRDRNQRWLCNNSSLWFSFFFCLHLSAQGLMLKSCIWSFN